MQCPKCKTELQETRGNYNYVESGLSEVTLLNIKIYECSKCGGKAPSIHNVLGVHDKIASALMAKKDPFTPEEVRFLERELKSKTGKAHKHAVPLHIDVYVKIGDTKCV